MRLFKRPRYIPFQLSNTWCVLNRRTGELVDLPNGLTEKYPEQWARTRAKQLNKGVSKP